jgi:hypothetical protein
MRICFYNHFHNGDLFANREFIKWAAEAWKNQCCYIHVNNSKIYADLPVDPISLPDILKPNSCHYEKIIQTDDTIYVNTWIGCYMAWASKDDVIVTDPITGLNWITYYKMWMHICNKLNELLGTNVKLPNNVEEFVGNPQSEFYVTKSFLETKIDLGQRNVLVSNGPALSGQSFQNHNMESWLTDLVQKYLHVQWIFTHPTSLIAPNVFYTSMIFDNRVCDLNEIGELSKYCEIIIGRNSGPFLFCNTRHTLYDVKKTFIATGRVRGDCFPAGLKLPCDYYWICDTDDAKTQSFVTTVIENKLEFS